MKERPTWGPDASDVPVKVYYKTKLPDGHYGPTNWMKMSHSGYFKWLFEEATPKGHQLVSVEQMREE